MTDYYTMAEATRITGFTRSRIIDIAEKAGVTVVDGIPADIVNDIVREKETYISFREFAAIPRGDRYDGSTSSKRKLLDKLEVNDYYGINLVDPEDLIIGDTKDVVYILRADIPKLETHLAGFFGLYALTEKEKVERFLCTTDRSVTKAHLKEYIENKMIGRDITPSFTEFVALVLKLPDLPKITDEEIKRILSVQMSVAAKNALVDFLNYAKERLPKTKFSKLKKKVQESNPIPAYTNETYLALAKCIFNAEYIDQHKMIERALENHLYIEMWLYLAVHYCCGWRAGDICEGWRYLRLNEKPDNSFGINTETLYEDILTDRIPDKVYEDVCLYATQKIAVSGQHASKTAGTKAPPLTITIEPALATFFGLLTLISEAVMMRTGDGYMRSNRATVYQKKTLYKQFFGQDMYDALHGQNIQSRRLNKDYLQGIEETARQSGCGSLMASAVASFARSHSNLNTIAHYLNDHTLNAENADMVLYFMLERGVFGFELYRALLTAYPDAMKKLPMKKQNELMAAVADNPFQIELEHSGLLAKLCLKDSFESGDNEKVLGVLKGMYEISQGRGKAKDEGIHCICRARGNPCAYPEYDSCLANACPHLVFTRYGYRALLEVIYEYKVGADAGDGKKAAVLQQIIMPNFRDVINALMKEVNMNNNERAGMRFMLEEVVSDGREYSTAS